MQAPVETGRRRKPIDPVNIDSRKEQGIARMVARFTPLRRFGWSFLLAWVFCVFYTEVVEGYAGKLGVWFGAYGSFELLFFTGFPVFMSVVMLVAIVLGEKRFGSPTEHLPLFFIAPVATALSTPLLFGITGDVAFTVALFVFGAVLTGFGSGFMWVMWGEYYARVSQEDGEFLAPASAIFSALLVLLVSAMDGWIALAFVTSLPLLSGLCFYLSWKDVGGAATAEHSGASERKAYDYARNLAKQSLVSVLASMGRAGLGILVACLFVCLLGTFWPAPDKHAPEFQAVLLASIAFMAVVSFASTVGPRRISIAFLYRWMCPVLVMGFVALILFGTGLGGYWAFLISIAARFAFCVITQLYFARYAVAGKATAVQSYGLGWIFVHLGDFLGVLLYAGLTEPLDSGSLSAVQVAAVSIAVLVVVTMFVLNDTKSFAFDRESSRGSSVDVSAVRTDEADGQERSGAELSDRIRELALRFELTPRETEVFELLARGRSIPYVRDALVISKETAATHAKHIYAKLGVHSRQELIDLVH
ncbi:response regulator transcription factor [Raoultibacter massiliensis]|uniref:helix-turn-helix transcriptional regulator n=1 Tax=Raoultibacter massiliensis TaxID=1852371 RepID=UPI003A92A1CF